MSQRVDATLRNARREAWILLATWAIATAYCCIASYLMGYSRADRPLTAADVHPTLEIPQWFLWSVIAPWVACGIFTLVFAGFFMKEDDLGSDRVNELDIELREGAPDAAG